MLKNHPKARNFLIWLLCMAISVPIYLLADGVLFGVDAGNKLPDTEKIVRIEVWSSDFEKVRIETETFTDVRDISMIRNLLDALCDYNLVYMGVEDIPRLTVKMFLANGVEYIVVVGNESVNFDGTFKGLRNKDAAQILTEQLLG